MTEWDTAPAAAPTPPPISAPCPAPRPPPKEDRRDEPPAVAPLRVVPPPDPAPAPAPPPPSADEALLSQWVALLNHLAEARPELAAILEHAAPLSRSADEIVVGYPPDSVFSKQASEKETLEALKRAARTVLGKEPHVVIELDSERARAFDTVAAREVRAREQRVRKAMHAAKNHPSVLGAVEIPGARIKDVKLANE